jgi:hypothetical protein
MPKKKHRLSWLYEELAAGNAARAPEEDTLAVSPVEVAYPFDIIAENALTEEPPAIETEEAPNDVPAEASPAEDYPIVEKALPAEESPIAEEAALIEECPIAEEAAPTEECPIAEETAPTEECPIAEETAPTEECLIAEETAPTEECPTAEETAPIEECPIAEEAAPREENPTVEEVPAAYPPIEEAKADSGLEAAQQTKTLSESKVDDSDEETSGNAEKPEDQAGEVVLICTSCTIMLLIEHEGPCPYSVISLMGSYYEAHSWLLHTTCFSCVNKHKHKRVSRDSFSNKCLAAFTAALLSEEFIKRTSWFEVAGRVCRKPIRIVMDEGRRLVAYEKIDVMREETTSNCRIRGLKSVGSRVGMGGRSELIESFVPGGFM